MIIMHEHQKLLHTYCRPENWSLAAVARELHCSKTCIFNIKRGWQENRPMRIGVGKVSLLKFTFTLIMYIYFSVSFLLLQLFIIKIVTPAARTPMNTA
jgi:hypothetical protein